MSSYPDSHPPTPQELSDKCGTDNRLTRKQRAFVEAYLRTWNASEAARMAGYRNRANTAGARLMSKDVIKAAIEKRLDEMAMETNEILARLTQQARANIYDFIELDRDGQIVRFNEDALRERGYLVKKLATSEGKTTSLGIEMYDAHAALVDLGRYRALFVDRTDITSKGEKIIVTLKGHDPTS